MTDEQRSKSEDLEQDLARLEGLVASPRDTEAWRADAGEALSRVRQRLSADALAREQHPTAWSFPAIVRGTTDALFTKDREGRYVSVNDAYARALGRPIEDIVGRRDEELLPIEVARRIVESDRDVVSTGKVINYEERLRVGDAVTVHLSTKGPIRDAREEIVGVFSISRDVTAAKRTEETLRARARQLAATAEIGQRALTTVPVARFLDEVASRVARALEVEYVKILELLPGGDTLLLRAGVGWREGLVGHATVDAGADSLAGYTLISRAAVVVEDLQTEPRFSGLRFLLDHGVVSSISVAIPGVKRPYGTLGAATRVRRAFSGDDVAFLESVAHLVAAALDRSRLLLEVQTARRRAELAWGRMEFLYRATTTLLAESLDFGARLEKLARLVVPNLADWCFILLDGDPPQRALIHSDPVKTAWGRHFVERHAFDPNAVNPAARALRTGRSELGTEVPESALQAMARSPAELEDLRSLGLTSFIVAPLRARERTYGVIMLISAESMRRYGDEDRALLEELAYRASLALENARLFEEIERVSRAREGLVTAVSHDLKNAIHALVVTSTMLTNALGSGPETAGARSYAERIRRGAEGMKGLIQAVLDAAVIDVGKLPVKLAPRDPAPLVHEAVDLMRAAAAEKSIDLTAPVPEGLPPVVCDRERLIQLLLNLIGNALKFTTRGAVIVSATSAGREVVFSVEDTGPGIPEDDLPHVFERYWQAKETASLGTGLGLFIAKGIVEAQGGRIWATSKPGVGTTFSFSLPAAERPAAPQAA